MSGVCALQPACTCTSGARQPGIPPTAPTLRVPSPSSSSCCRTWRKVRIWRKVLHNDIQFYIRRIRDSRIQKEIRFGGRLCLVEQLLPHRQEGIVREKFAGKLCKLTLGAPTSGWRMWQLQSRAESEAWKGLKACGKTIPLSTAHIRKAPWQAVHR